MQENQVQEKTDKDLRLNLVPKGHTPEAHGDLLERVAEVLAEHFDGVQLMGSVTIGGDTIDVFAGVGNMHCREGACRNWLQNPYGDPGPGVVIWEEGDGPFPGAPNRGDGG